MASEGSTNSVDLGTLLAALPACKRCRKTRRRCDTKLPSCENCVKAGVECIYYDHVLEEDLPRSYVASLVDHLEKGSDLSASPSDGSHMQRPFKFDDAGDKKQHFFAFSQGTYRYIGTHSPLMDVHLHNGVLREPYERRIPFLSQVGSNNDTIGPDLHRYLLRFFFESIHQVYPILDPALPWLSPDTRMESNPPPTQGFVIQMIHGIACLCTDANDSSLVPLASAAHARALRYIEKATAEPSISTLQVAILLVLYTLFDPSSDNISQRLGFAIRLVIDLAGTDGYDQAPTLMMLQKVIYCLENHVCSVLVRPTALPEPSSPLSFSTEQPLEFLCNALWTITDQGLHPNVLSTLWETRLMLDPSTSVAAELISAYSKEGFIATFLTAYWVHKAASLIIDAVGDAEGPLKSELMLVYGSSIALLGQWSRRWKGAKTLLECLQSRLRAEVHRDGVGT